MKAEITSLHVYPIKSCGAIDLTTLKVGARGGLWDRSWMVVAQDTGLFLTQRQLTQMTQIRTELTDSHLVVTTGMSQFSVPLEKPTSERSVARVWSDDCIVIDEGDEAAQALSEFLGKQVRLVHMAPEFQRHIPEKFKLPEAHTGFADQMPFLLTTEESLHDLNSRLKDPVPMNRFRPNIVIRGLPPFAEDEWKRLRIGEIEFNVVQPCSRCVIINTDQKSGEKNPEPLKTLADFRRHANNKVYFGMHLVHRSQGTLRVGDSVEILS